MDTHNSVFLHTRNQQVDISVTIHVNGCETKMILNRPEAAPIRKGAVSNSMKDPDPRWYRRLPRYGDVGNPIVIKVSNPEEAIPILGREDIPQFQTTFVPSQEYRCI
jgi:hypothetical protein